MRMLSSQRLDHRPHVDVGHFRRPRDLEGADHHKGHILRLDEPLRMISSILKSVNGRLARGGRAAGVDAQDAHAFGIQLLPQAVSESLEGLLGGRVLTKLGPRVPDNAGVHEHDLAPAGLEQRQQGLREEIAPPNVDAVQGVEVANGRRRHGPPEVDSVAEHEKIDVPELPAEACREPLDVLVASHVGAIGHRGRRFLLNSLHNAVQGVSVATHQAESGPFGGKPEGDRFADPPARSGDHRDLLFKRSQHNPLVAGRTLVPELPGRSCRTPSTASRSQMLSSPVDIHVCHRIGLHGLEAQSCLL